MTDYKKVTRKSRDPKEKTKGTRLSRNRFHPKGHKPPTFGKKKPKFTVEITETSGGSTPKSWWDLMDTVDRRSLLSRYEPKWKSHDRRSFEQLNPQEQNWVRESFVLDRPRKKRDLSTLEIQRQNFGSEFREKGGDELTEKINAKWENVIVKGTMHKFSKGYALHSLDDLIRNYRAFFDDTNWEMIADERGKVGIIQEIRKIKKESLLFAGERLKDKFGYGEPEPRPNDQAGQIVQKLNETFEVIKDEQIGQIKEREADFLMAKTIIADASDEIQGESQEQLLRGLKL